MYIRLDVFASLLRVRPGELLHAARTGGMFDGIQLPPSRQVRGRPLCLTWLKRSVLRNAGMRGSLIQPQSLQMNH